jgi:hypothetical protein
MYIYKVMLFCVLIYPLSASATDWRPFIATGVMISMPQKFDVYENILWPVPNKFIALPTCSGLQFEAGIHGKRSEWYVAYQECKSQDWLRYSYANSSQADNDMLWSETQKRGIKREQRNLFLGYRIRAKQVGSIEPMLGVGFSLGFVKDRQFEETREQEYRRVQDSLYYHYELISSQYSWKEVTKSKDLLPGIEGEFGVVYKIIQGVEAVFLMQLVFQEERHDEKSLSEPPYHGSIIPTASFNLRYVFGDQKK